jgi:carbon-monoxide dehydrogenase medium subunit
MTVSGGRVATCAIGLTNVGDRPLHAENAAKAAIGTALDGPSLKRAAEAAEALAAPAEDGRGSKEYRTKMAGVMARRALERAFARATA